ncbi:Cotton fiber expressed protein [Carex littledalei]|uniref:Cotton fiber expressed protein n=1 Tax=Carex littledalei TaxID=544730 RepID=A0A833QUH4_9POAL|nr:Cotton fiber expressed protein [Carex littledalei]
MEQERNNGMANNAIVVVFRKSGIKKRGLQALWAAILLQFKIRAPKKATIAAPKDKKENTSESPDKSETTWKDIVGGIRPLHLQPLDYHSSISLPPPPPPPPFDKEIYHDVLLPPSSPEHSSDGMSSSYCSAVDLQALDKSSDDTEGAIDVEGGSDVINTQAEEFIAKFYDQIRLQRLQSLSESNC